MSRADRPAGEGRSAARGSTSVRRTRPPAPPLTPTGHAGRPDHAGQGEQKAAGGWLPHPWLSALLALAWLMLQQSLAVPQVLTALILGLGLPHLLRRFLGSRLRVRGVGPALRFAAIVLGDIVVSNLTVARLVLRPRARPQPAWIAVPYELESPVAITLLASIITMTPGTVSAVIDEERRTIHVHALDCDDPSAMTAQIVERYERPLKELIG